EETSPCSEEVVFPALGIHRYLPAFETTLVEIPPTPAGEYAFACGMDMLHGRLVLSDAPVPAQERPPAPQQAAAAVDPICGMTVDPARAAGSSVRDGVTTYFCSLGCKRRFDEAGPGAASGAQAPEQRVSLGVRRKP